MTDRFDLLADDIQALLLSYNMQMAKGLVGIPFSEQARAARDLRDGIAMEPFWNEVDAFFVRFDSTFPDTENRTGVWSACSDGKLDATAEDLRLAGSDQARLALILNAIAAATNVYPGEHTNTFSSHIAKRRFAPYWNRLKWMNEETAKMWREIDQMKSDYEDKISVEQDAIHEKYRKMY